MIYLDYAATTPIRDEVLDVYCEVSKKYYGNTSSLHDIGTEADEVVSYAREVFAELINGVASGIYFTSGGTEANELAVLSLLNGNVEKGKHVITTEAEHASLYNTFRYLEQDGYEVTYLGLNKHGQVDIPSLEAAIRPDTVLASIHHGNAEIGTLQKVKEIGSVLRKSHVLYHTDCVQTFGKVPIDVRELEVDSLSISSHKIYGPKGIGLAYIHPNVAWERDVKGITHEAGFRAGTVNVPGIFAFAQAAKLVGDNMFGAQRKYEKYREMFLNALGEMNLPIKVISSVDFSLPNMVGLTFDRVQGQHIMLEYNRHGIAVSVGSACQVGKQEPSRTMLAMGMSEDEAKQLVRISFGSKTTENEIKQLITVTEQIVMNV